MKVLFVSSGNKNYEISPLVQSQGSSLINNGLSINYFKVQGSYIKNILILRKKILDNKYDIIHAHYSYSAFLCLLTFTKIPIIVSYMGSDIQGKIKFNIKSFLIYFFNKIIFRITEYFVSRIIVKSKGLFDLINYKYKAKIIPNGIDFNKFKPMDKLIARKKLKINNKFKYILFLANRNNKNKNFKLLGDAMSLINDGNIKLLEFNYPIPPNLVPVYINAADLLVLTSLSEGSPNVVKEALACCKPIVSVNVGDVKKNISDVDGCYLSKYDINDLSIKIIKALNFKGKNSGRHKIKNLEINKIALLIIDLYKEIIK